MIALRILTERLELLPIDLDIIHSSLFKKYIKNRKNYKPYLKALSKDSDLLGWGVWLVVSKNSNVIIGDIGFKGKPIDETVEVGYGFSPHARNKGYATESVTALIEWAFSTNRVEKVMAQCLSDNHSSIKVLEKIGMQRTEINDELITWNLHKV